MHSDHCNCNNYLADLIALVLALMTGPAGAVYLEDYLFVGCLVMTFIIDLNHAHMNYFVCLSLPV